jgi:hypothetical protein
MGNNVNNLKVGDQILVEQAWETESGEYIDELATITKIEDDGLLELEWPNASEEIKSILQVSEFYANNYKKYVTK